MDGASLLRARVARGILFAALGGTFWGFSGTCAQLLTTTYGLDPGWIICIRLPFAALLFLAVSAVRERDRLIAAVRDPKTLIGIVLFAIFGILLTQYSYLTAISLTNAGTGTVMERLGLVLLTILVCAMARRLPHVREVVGVLLAVAGTFFIATKGSFDGLAIPPEALVWGFLLACGFVGYTLLPEKLLAKWGSFIVTGLGMLVAGVIICAGHGRGAGRDGGPRHVSGVPVLPPGRQGGRRHAGGACRMHRAGRGDGVLGRMAQNRRHVGGHRGYGAHYRYGRFGYGKTQE